MKTLKNFIYSSIPKNRKQYISNCIKEYNKKYPNQAKGMFPVTRNKVGIPFHMAAFGKCVVDIFEHIKTGNFQEIPETFLLSKLNLDFAIWINNINKIKASGFSKFLKEKNITDKNELKYGISKYLFKAGSYHYPILHPHKTERLATTGEYKKTFETGIFFTRTDKKTLTNKLERYFINKSKNQN